MKTWFRLASLVVLAGSWAPLSSVAVEDAYRLQPADQLFVSVWREEELTRQVLVLPDGTITFPLIGSVSVAGLTSNEAEERISEKLKKYIPDPAVSVTVSGINGNRIFLIGKVNNPGVFVMYAPTDVLQALSFGGGFNRFADVEDILILRRAQGTVSKFKFDYNAVASGKDLDTNIMLQPNDVIIVP